MSQLEKEFGGQLERELQELKKLFRTLSSVAPHSGQGSLLMEAIQALQKLSPQQVVI